MTALNRPRIGLALSGGVTRGPAHIGVLQVLTEAGIPIDYVAGVSVGSLIGAVYCAGLPLEQITELAFHIGWRQLARPVWPRTGFISFKRLEQFLINTIGDVQFDQLSSPFAAGVTNLLTGEPLLLRDGRVATAVHASCAVPGFVVPVQRDGLLLGDGGASCNLPGQQVRILGADYVIGVDLMMPHLRRRGGPFRFGLLGFETLVQRSGGGPDAVDCLIRPDLAGISFLSFQHTARLIERGAHAARQQLDTILAALHSLSSQQLPVMHSAPETP
jgi:NTE family protein